MVFNAEGGGGGGSPDPAAPPVTTPAAPESVLFPNDGKGGDGKESKPAAPAGDWKEYVPDPNKSDADNAAAKAEHDKTKPAEGDKKADPLDVVPEDGKYTLTMPEGVEVDQGLLDAMSPRFKELGLTSKQAQALADDFIKLQQQRMADHASSPEGAWSGVAHEYFKANGTPDKWADTAKADKDMGGDKWDGTVQNATRFVNTMGTPELKEFLNKSGGGNHPELIRIFAKAGALIREDNPPPGGAVNSQNVDAAHILFKNDVPKGN